MDGGGGHLTCISSRANDHIETLSHWSMMKLILPLSEHRSKGTVDQRQIQSCSLCCFPPPSPYHMCKGYRTTLSNVMWILRQIGLQFLTTQSGDCTKRIFFSSSMDVKVGYNGVMLPREGADGYRPIKIAELSERKTIWKLSLVVCQIVR